MTFVNGIRLVRIRISLKYNSYNVDRILSGEDVYIVYELFWRIMSQGFNSFSEFDSYVIDNASLKKIEYPISGGRRDSGSIELISVLDCE